jgi:hypothetical protein
MSPSGHTKENPPVTAVTRQGLVEARLILLTGLVVSNLDAPENEARRLNPLKYSDRPCRPGKQRKKKENSGWVHPIRP